VWGILSVLLDLFIITPLKAVSYKRVLVTSFDDFHHNGLMIELLEATPLFGIQKTERTTRLGIKCQIWGLKTITNFFLDAGPLSI
jgi:hypothetical protein